MRLNIPIGVLILGLLIGVFSCKCDDPSDPTCENYDPCLEFTIPTASFNMYHFRPILFEPTEYLFFPVDTAVDESPVRFRAMGVGDTFKWLIGNEIDYRYGRDVEVFFEGFSGDISVTLLSISALPQGCTHQTITEIESTKSFYIKDIPNVHSGNPNSTLSYYGKYRGLFHSSNDSIEIELQYGPPNWIPRNGKGISNFPDSEFCPDDNSIWHAIISFNDFFWLQAGQTFDPCRPLGIGKYDKSTKQLSIRYWYYVFEEGYHNEKEHIIDSIQGSFIGIKIE